MHGPFPIMQGLGCCPWAQQDFSVHLLRPAWCHQGGDIFPVLRWQQFWMSQVLSRGSVGNVWLLGNWELPKQLFPFSLKDSGGNLLQNHPMDYISLLGVHTVPEVEISSSFTYLIVQKTGTRNKIVKST